MFGLRSGPVCLSVCGIDPFGARACALVLGCQPNLCTFFLCVSRVGVRTPTRSVYPDVSLFTVCMCTLLVMFIVCRKLYSWPSTKMVPPRTGSRYDAMRQSVWREFGENPCLSSCDYLSHQASAVEDEASRATRALRVLHVSELPSLCDLNMGIHSTVRGAAPLTPGVTTCRPVRNASPWLLLRHPRRTAAGRARP